MGMTRLEAGIFLHALLHTVFVITNTQPVGDCFEHTYVCTYGIYCMSAADTRRSLQNCTESSSFFLEAGLVWKIGRTVDDRMTRMPGSTKSCHGGMVPSLRRHPVVRWSHHHGRVGDLLTLLDVDANAFRVGPGYHAVYLFVR